MEYPSTLPVAAGGPAGSFSSPTREICMKTRIRKWLLFAALAATVAFIVFDRMRNESAAGVAGRSASTADGAAAKASGGDPEVLALPGRSPIGEARTGLFSSNTWQPPVSKNAVVARSAPVAPPIPYRYAGKIVQGGQHTVLLSRGEKVFPIKQGETLDGEYLVESIEESQITLKYLPLGKKEVIPFLSSLWPSSEGVPARAGPAGSPQPDSVGAGPAGKPSPPVAAADPGRENVPASLLWQGPQEVKLGTQFSVALRVSSAQPVGASPMQIRVNPAFLEAISVKPGRYFEDGKRTFNYRIDPGGSIFVAASSPNPAPAADAELLVLTLMPLREAPAAELAIASLSLHGPAGRVIPFDYPAAFKTAITP